MPHGKPVWQLIEEAKAILREYDPESLAEKYPK